MVDRNPYVGRLALILQDGTRVPMVASWDVYATISEIVGGGEKDLGQELTTLLERATDGDREHLIRLAAVLAAACPEMTADEVWRASPAIGEAKRALDSLFNVLWLGREQFDVNLDGKEGAGSDSDPVPFASYLRRIFGRRSRTESQPQSFGA